MSATSEMIPYPCWLPDASAVRIRNVASCIARVLITATYIDELAVGSPHLHAMKPDIQCVRTHWIRGFMSLQLARSASAAPALPDGPGLLRDPEHHPQRPPAPPPAR